MHAAAAAGTSVRASANALVLETRGRTCLPKQLDLEPLVLDPARARGRDDHRSCHGLALAKERELLGLPRGAALHRHGAPALCPIELERDVHLALESAQQARHGRAVRARARAPAAGLGRRAKRAASTVREQGTPAPAPAAPPQARTERGNAPGTPPPALAVEPARGRVWGREMHVRAPGHDSMRIDLSFVVFDVDGDGHVKGRALLRRLRRAAGTAESAGGGGAAAVGCGGSGDRWELSDGGVEGGGGVR